MLAKADLLTDMVGEFPELQGVMGRYYALNDNEAPELAIAIEDHYKPRFAGDELPRNQVGVVLALADKFETLVGMFGNDNLPTGDKDPFALRRHALGVIRLMVDKERSLELTPLLRAAVHFFNFAHTPAKLANEHHVANQLTDFIYDRFAGSLREQGYSAQEVDAVISLRPPKLAEVAQRLAAVRAFAQLPEAPALAAANKRVGNILKKVEGSVEAKINPALLQPGEELALADALKSVALLADSAWASGLFEENLKALAALKDPVDAFFDKVMVNHDDPAIRANRLGLLATLHQAMNRVADLSKLAA
jgi:glycyl-tRNA synthetase beta chain